MKKSFFAFRLFLVHTLVLALSLGPALPMAAFAAPPDDKSGTPGNQSAPSPHSVEGFAKALDTATETTPPPANLDPELLTKQYHRVFQVSPDGSQDLLQAEYPLARVDVNNPTVSILDASREIRFAYDANRGELSMVRLAKHDYTDSEGKKQTRDRVTDAHVFKNVTVTSNVAGDPNLILFATPQGIRAIQWSQLRESIFKAPVIAPIVAPAPAAGGTIKKIEFLTRASQPRQFVQPVTRIEAGDIAVTMEVETVAKEGAAPVNQSMESFLPRNEVMMAMRVHMLGTLAMIQVVDPNLDTLEPVQAILRENSKDLAAFLQARNAVLLKGQGNDLARHALQNLSAHTDVNALIALFKKNAEGKDAYQALSESPRDVFDADPNGEWKKAYELIQKAQEADVAAGKAPRAWRQVLVSAFKDGDEASIKAGAEAEAKVVRSYGERIEGAFKALVTRGRIKALGAVLAGVGVNYAFGGAPVEWAMSSMSHLLTWSTTLPVIGSLTAPVVKSLAYFSDAWSVSRWVLGTGLMVALYPISLAVAKVASLRNGKGWDGARALFNYGIRGYAYANYPLQKLLVWDRVAPAHTYRALDLGVNPFQSAERINKKIDERATRKTRALLIAATLVSEVQAEKGNPVDIGTLLMAAQGKQLDSFADLTANATENARWTEATMLAYKALAKMGDQGVGPIDEKSIVEYYKLYTDVALAFKERGERQGTIGAHLGNSLKWLYTRSKGLMSKQVIPFLLYGKQGYDVFQKFRSVEVDHTTAEISKESYRDDYIASAIYYGAVASEPFGNLPMMGKGAPRILSDQLAQVFIYGIQGPVGPLSAAGANMLDNPYPPLSDDFYSQLRVREQTFVEGTAAIAGRTADKNSLDYFTNHAKYMSNTLDGLQVRFLIDYVTRAVGMYFTLTAAGAGISILASALDTAQLSLFFLLNKIAFQAGAIGYATVWPYIHLSMRHMKDAAARNLKLIQIADYLIETGTRLKDRGMIERGVLAMRLLFEEGKIEVPAQFRIPAKDFTEELAREFHQYSMKTVPLPTKGNSLISKVLNIGLGAAVSTVLFDSLSFIAYDTASDPFTKLQNSLFWFGTTYIGLRVLAPVVPRVAKVVNAVGGVVNKYFIGPVLYPATAPLRFGLKVVEKANERVNRVIDGMLGACSGIFGKLAAKKK